MNIKVIIKNFVGWLGNSKQERYFTFALMAFMFSYLVLPTTKMVNNFYYISLAVPAFICFVCAKSAEFFKKPTAAIFMLFLGWLIIPGTLSGDFQFFRHIVYIFLFLVVAMVLVDPSPFHDSRFSRFLFWAVCIYVIGSAVIYWAQGVYPVGKRVLWLPSRMTGPIYTSMWVAACFSLVAPTWLRERRWIEGGAGLFCALFSVMFVLQSRSGLVGIILLMVFLLLNFMYRRKRQSVVLFALLSAFGVVLWLLREAPGIKRVFSGSVTNRPEIWTNAVTDWVDCGLWLGCGLDHQFSLTLPKGSLINHPHNIYLSLGIYTGLIALLLFLLWAGRVLLLSFRQRNPWGLYLFMSLVMLCFDGSLIIESPDELWLLVFLPAGVISSRDNQT